ncbi:MAG: nucleotidyltransferase domain-containing protein [Cytophagaceae bacterium]|nr:nucleotidyltransferase domain-containing protein [Cytophagaceae bacterium]
MPYGLTDQQLERIRATLAAIPAIRQAVLFGSRAKGTHKPGSDIDLALKGPRLELNDSLTLANRLEDLDLPYSFDLVVYHHIQDAPLIEHIDRIGKLLYQAEPMLSESVT